MRISTWLFVITVMASLAPMPSRADTKDSKTRVDEPFFEDRWIRRLDEP